MISFDAIQKQALSYPQTTEEPHFEKTSFRVKGKIFSTWDPKKSLLTVKLDEIEQDVFCRISPNAIYPVANKWGKQGWTVVNPALLTIEIIKDILSCSYCRVAPPKLAALVNPDKF